MEEPKLLTTKEVAERLGITPSRVRQILIDGKIEGRKHGRDWFVREDVLEKSIKMVVRIK